MVRGCVPGREGDGQLSKGWSICHMLGHAGAGSTRAAEARAAAPKRRLGARRAAWWTTLVFLGLWKAFEVVMLHEMSLVDSWELGRLGSLRSQGSRPDF